MYSTKLLLNSSSVVLSLIVSAYNVEASPVHLYQDVDLDFFFYSYPTPPQSTPTTPLSDPFLMQNTLNTSGRFENLSSSNPIPIAEVPPTPILLTPAPPPREEERLEAVNNQQSSQTKTTLNSTPSPISTSTHSDLENLPQIEIPAPPVRLIQVPGINWPPREEERPETHHPQPVQRRNEPTHEERKEALKRKPTYEIAGEDSESQFAIYRSIIKDKALKASFLQGRAQAPKAWNKMSTSQKMDMIFEEVMKGLSIRVQIPTKWGLSKQGLTHFLNQHQKFKEFIIRIKPANSHLYWTDVDGAKAQEWLNMTPAAQQEDLRVALAEGQPTFLIARARDLDHIDLYAMIHQNAVLKKSFMEGRGTARKSWKEMNDHQKWDAIFEGTIKGLSPKDMLAHLGIPTSNTSRHYKILKAYPQFEDFINGVQNFQNTPQQIQESHRHGIPQGTSTQTTTLLSQIPQEIEQPPETTLQPIQSQTTEGVGLFEPLYSHIIEKCRRTIEGTSVPTQSQTTEVYTNQAPNRPFYTSEQLGGTQPRFYHSPPNASLPASPWVAPPQNTVWPTFNNPAYPFSVPHGFPIGSFPPASEILTLPQTNEFSLEKGNAALPIPQQQLFLPSMAQPRMTTAPRADNVELSEGDRPKKEMYQELQRYQELLKQCHGSGNSLWQACQRNTDKKIEVVALLKCVVSSDTEICRILGGPSRCVFDLKAYAKKKLKARIEYYQKLSLDAFQSAFDALKKELDTHLAQRLQARTTTTSATPQPVEETLQITPSQKQGNPPVFELPDQESSTQTDKNVRKGKRKRSESGAPNKKRRTEATRTETTPISTTGSNADIPITIGEESPVLERSDQGSSLQITPTNSTPQPVVEPRQPRVLYLADLFYSRMTEEQRKERITEIQKELGIEKIDYQHLMINQYKKLKSFIQELRKQRWDESEIAKLLNCPIEALNDYAIDNQKIKDWTREGWTTKKIAKELRYSTAYMKTKKRELGLTINRPEIDDQKIREWTREGWTTKQIAEESGYSIRTIHEKKKKLGLTINSDDPNTSLDELEDDHSFELEDESSEELEDESFEELETDNSLATHARRMQLQIPERTPKYSEMSEEQRQARIKQVQEKWGIGTLFFRQMNDEQRKGFISDLGEKGWDCKEIAAILNCTLPTMKSFWKAFINNRIKELSYAGWRDIEIGKELGYANETIRHRRDDLRAPSAFNILEYGEPLETPQMELIKTLAVQGKSTPRQMSIKANADLKRVSHYLKWYLISHDKPERNINRDKIFVLEPSGQGSSTQTTTTQPDPGPSERESSPIQQRLQQSVEVTSEPIQSQTTETSTNQAPNLPFITAEQLLGTRPPFYHSPPNTALPSVSRVASLQTNVLEHSGQGSSTQTTTTTTTNTPQNPINSGGPSLIQTANPLNIRTWNISPATLIQPPRPSSNMSNKRRIGESIQTETTTIATPGSNAEIPLTIVDESADLERFYQRSSLQTTPTNTTLQSGVKSRAINEMYKELQRYQERLKQCQGSGRSLWQSWNADKDKKIDVVALLKCVVQTDTEICRILGAVRWGVSDLIRYAKKKVNARKQYYQNLPLDEFQRAYDALKKELDTHLAQRRQVTTTTTSTTPQPVEGTLQITPSPTTVVNTHRIPNIPPQIPEDPSSLELPDHGNSTQIDKNVRKNKRKRSQSAASRKERRVETSQTSTTPAAIADDTSVLKLPDQGQMKAATDLMNLLQQAETAERTLMPPIIPTPIFPAPQMPSVQNNSALDHGYLKRSLEKGTFTVSLLAGFSVSTQIELYKRTKENDELKKSFLDGRSNTSQTIHMNNGQKMDEIFECALKNHAIPDPTTQIGAFYHSFPVDSEFKKYIDSITEHGISSGSAVQHTTSPPPPPPPSPPVATSIPEETRQPVEAAPAPTQSQTTGGSTNQTGTHIRITTPTPQTIQQPVEDLPQQLAHTPTMTRTTTTTPLDSSSSETRSIPMPEEPDPQTVPPSQISDEQREERTKAENKKIKEWTYAGWSSEEIGKEIKCERAVIWERWEDLDLKAFNKSEKYGKPLDKKQMTSIQTLAAQGKFTPKQISEKANAELKRVLFYLKWYLASEGKPKRKISPDEPFTLDLLNKESAT